MEEKEAKDVEESQDTLQQEQQTLQELSTEYVFHLNLLNLNLVNKNLNLLQSPSGWGQVL